MRQIMIDTGLPQGTGGHIGPLPSMSAAIAEIDLILSTNNFNKIAFNISPNPSNGDININFSKIPSTNTKLNIYSVLGQKVYSSPLTNKRISLNLSALSKGIYMVILNDETTQTTKKLIIN